MFSAAKAQFDLAMAWSELAMSTLSATTMIATAGAKVMAANAEVDRLSRQPAQSPGVFFAPWFAVPAPRPIDPMRFAQAATEASTAFWSTLLGAPISGRGPSFWTPTLTPAPASKLAVKALPLWWTAFTDPAVSSMNQPSDNIPVPRSPYLH